LLGSIRRSILEVRTRRAGEDAMLWIWLTLAVIALVALRYVADSRDGQDRNPFAPRGSTARNAPCGPTGDYRRPHTPADDLAAVARAARAALQRIRWAVTR
jgi:hypothetical protein